MRSVDDWRVFVPFGLQIGDSAAPPLPSLAMPKGKKPSEDQPELPLSGPGGSADSAPTPVPYPPVPV
ncbi:hypothetical protein EBZ70_02985, partial [bacterium]|nr:hypothetical protein [bacterium]